MPPSTFAVTHVDVRDQYFPNGDPFSGNSVPTADAVTKIILGRAALLEGKLAAEDVAASSITVATSSAYLWCADTIRLAAAIKVMQGMTSQDPDVLKSWAAELRERFDDLAASGYLALGDGVTAPAEQADGPNHHIDEFNLEVRNTADIPDLTEMPSRDDEL